MSQPDGNNVSFIGITDYAQETLGEIVYVELPSVGDTFEQNETFGQIESVKAASELISPISGEVVEVNSELEDSPGLVNTAPESQAWMIKVKLSNSDDVSWTYNFIFLFGVFVFFFFRCICM